MTSQSASANSHRFLVCFNDIERHLRKVVDAGPEKSFRELVRLAAAMEPAVKRYADDLRQLADLRNAIVHQSKGEAIAEPHTRTCTLIESIARLLMDPPRVCPTFQRDVITMETSAPVSKMVTEAYHLSFSQFPITREGVFVGVITTNTITRWLGANAEDDVLSLEESVVADVFEYTEFPRNYEFVSRETDLLKVVDLFNRHDQTGQRLDAILITHNGKPSEQILGIISPWDLPEVFKHLAVA